MTGLFARTAQPVLPGVRLIVIHTDVHIPVNFLWMETTSPNIDSAPKSAYNSRSA